MARIVGDGTAITMAEVDGGAECWRKHYRLTRPPFTDCRITVGATVSIIIQGGNVLRPDDARYTSLAQVQGFFYSSCERTRSKELEEEDPMGQAFVILAVFEPTPDNSTLQKSGMWNGLCGPLCSPRTLRMGADRLAVERAGVIHSVHRTVPVLKGALAEAPLAFTPAGPRTVIFFTKD